MLEGILAGLKKFSEPPPEEDDTPTEEEIQERIKQANQELMKWRRSALKQPTVPTPVQEETEVETDHQTPESINLASASKVSGAPSEHHVSQDSGREEVTELSQASSNNTVIADETVPETQPEEHQVSAKSLEPQTATNSVEEPKRRLPMAGFLSKLSPGPSAPASQAGTDHESQDEGGGEGCLTKPGSFFKNPLSGISNQINCILPSTPDPPKEEDYKDVVLKVHVRLHRKQEKINVQLNVKVDPEETDHWLEPGEILPSEGEIDDDMGTIDSTSDGYHTQTTSSSDAYNGRDTLRDTKSLVPLGDKDQKMEAFFETMVRQKYIYDCTKTKLYDAIKTKILKLRQPSSGKFYNFTEICQILRDYLITAKIDIISAGELIYFEKAGKQPKHKVDSLTSLSQSSLSLNKSSKNKKVPSKDKKAALELVGIYITLQNIYRDYRTHYFNAMEEYGVQVVESRFGYFMCDMKEELLMGNMVLCGQVAPFYSDVDSALVD